jgi:hypothetical protein
MDDRIRRFDSRSDLRRELLEKFNKHRVLEIPRSREHQLAVNQRT